MATGASVTAPLRFRRVEWAGNLIHGLWRFTRRNPMGAASAAVLLALAVVALLAGFIAPYDPYALDPHGILQSPSADHWFGTDDFGRDAFSRLVYGARISLWVGTIAVAISAGIGTPLGIISAYAGGWVDSVIQRLVDALFAFPAIILGLTIVSVLGQGTTQVIVAVGIVNIPRVARIVRSSALAIVQQPYVEAARTIGANDNRMIVQHVLPNLLAPILILATAGFGFAILAEAALSYLGVGTPPPQPSWGLMLSGAAQKYVRSAPWLAIFPGIAISLAVFSINLLGDALRDTFDPRLRGAR